MANVKPVSYLQTDPRWKNVPYAVKGEHSTIGGSGCGPTSMAMVLATWADPAVTPLTECAWALKHGYKCLNSGTFYSYFVPAADRYRIKCTMLNGASIYGNSASPYHAKAKAAVDAGNLVIACMGKGNWTRSGHYVLVWQISGDTVTIFINDPASNLARRVQGSYNLFRSQVKYYWVLEKPAPAVRDTDYDVRITDKTGLNCRSGPGTSYAIRKAYAFRSVVHISKVTATGWGYTGDGWINLQNTEKVDIPEKEDELDMTIDEMLANMTGEQACELVSKALAYMGHKKEPGWSRTEGYYAKAEKEGIVKGGAPERPIKRDELVAILGRLGLLGDPLPVDPDAEEDPEEA